MNKHLINKLSGRGTERRHLYGITTEDGGSSLTNEKDHHYFLNRFVCVGEFFDG